MSTTSIVVIVVLAVALVGVGVASWPSLKAAVIAGWTKLKAKFSSKPAAK